MLTLSKLGTGGSRAKQHQFNGILWEDFLDIPGLNEPETDEKTRNTTCHNSSKDSEGISDNFRYNVVKILFQVCVCIFQFSERNHRINPLKSFNPGFCHPPDFEAQNLLDLDKPIFETLERWPFWCLSQKTVNALTCFGSKFQLIYSCVRRPYPTAESILIGAVWRK